MLETIITKAGIPLLISIICIYFGVRLMVTKDISFILGKDKSLPKDVAGYTKAGGLLIIFFGIATFIMAVLLFVNLYLAIAEITVCTVLFSLAWKKMTLKYE